MSIAEQLGRGFTVAIIAGVVIRLIANAVLARIARRRVTRELLLERYRQLQEP